MSEITNVWKKVFGRPKYGLIVLVSGILFYLLNVVIQSYSTLSSYYQVYGLFAALEFFVQLSYAFPYSIKFNSVVTLLLTAILFGILLSLIIFKAANTKERTGKQGITGTIGLFFALLAPGCAACGLGLVAALGLSSTIITILPYDGLELSVLAILILSFTIFKISKDLTVCQICRV